jgi:hypothetical protein
VRNGRSRHRLSRRPGCAGVHPLGENVDLRLRQLAGRRHREVFVAVVDRLEDQAFREVLGVDRRPVVAAFDDQRAMVEPKPAPLLLVVVAFEAAFDEQRTDLLLEEIQLRRRERWLGGFRYADEGKHSDQNGNSH